MTTFQHLRTFAAVSIFSLVAVSGAHAESTTTAGIPDRVIVLSGSNDSISPTVMTVLYDTRDVHFQDLGVPRYLFVDREGTTALGIGGNVLGLAEYDFDGSVDKAGFYPRLISVPSAPGRRERMGFDASHTSLFLKLVRQTRLGMLCAYVQTNFTGDDGGYGMKLKQAYVTLANVTMGLANSTFADPSTIPPTVDYQGPAGQASTKNVLVRYQRKFGNGFVTAASLEMPKSSYTTGSFAANSPQRFPDIPAYVQYEWNKAKSHIRLSGIFRRLSYLDEQSQTSRFVSGWGAQLSGVERIGPATIYAQGTYGKGIAQYLNDLSGAGFDLIPASEAGRLKAPAAFGMLAGLRYDITKKMFASATYSFCRLYSQRELAPSTYMRGDYVAANIFYTPFSDMQFGIEYVHGARKNIDGQSGCANRVEAMVKYFF